MEQGSFARLAWLVLLPAAGIAQAQEIHRCVDRGGRVSLQGAPCAPNQRLTHTTHVAAAERRPDIEARNAQVAAEMDRRNRRQGAVTRPSSASHGRRATPSESQRRSADCSAAKARRDALLRQAGLRRTFDLLRRLDDAVHRACR